MHQARNRSAFARGADAIPSGGDYSQPDWRLSGDRQPVAAKISASDREDGKGGLTSRFQPRSRGVVRSVSGHRNILWILSSSESFSHSSHPGVEI